MVYMLAYWLSNHNGHYVEVLAVWPFPCLNRVNHIVCFPFISLYGKSFLRAHGIVACFPYINRQTVAVSNRLLISDPFFLAYLNLSTGCEFEKCVLHGMAITFIKFKFWFMFLCSLRTGMEY